MEIFLETMILFISLQSGFLSGVLLNRITGLIGKMLEWLKRHAWKACIPQKGIPSSNLGLSAPFLMKVTKKSVD